MNPQVKLKPSTFAALDCPRCLVLAGRHSIESKDFKPRMGNFPTREEQHFVGLNIGDEVLEVPRWTVTLKGSETLWSAPLPLVNSDKPQ